MLTKTAPDPDNIDTIADAWNWYFAEAKAGRHKPTAKPKKESTLAIERRYFESHVLAQFGEEKLSALSNERIQSFIESIAEEASPGAARQCWIVLNAVYSFAVWKGVASDNPCKEASAPEFEVRERVLTEEELRRVWRIFRATATKALHNERPAALAILLAAVTLQRGSEIVTIRKKDIDREARVWTIPADQAKDERPHLVPLSDMALGLINEAERLAKDLLIDSPYLFPSPSRSVHDGRPIERRAFTKAFQRAMTNEALQSIKPHDLRRTGAFWLQQRLSVPAEIVSRILNDSEERRRGKPCPDDEDVQASIPAKRQALEAWAIVLSETAGN